MKSCILYNQKRYLKTSIRPRHQFVFYGIDFQPVSHAAIAKVMNWACKKANIKRITFHGLRHTHASILLHKKIPIEYISKRLGHASTSITFDTYSHLTKEFEEQENEKTVTFLNQINAK
ncbi:tyrosine-type recombinase/integrase [Allofustis seminis]|uniref:tyrosine-type recombinase/integrase n=1 Tax=Allofustis seminis TaxID=166939 RepID=UPI0004783AF9|nr:tyrosine-type recombinase/integrase [Allofustis seminis]